MVKALHRGRHRGDPRRRLQPHRRGRPRRAGALLPRHRQRAPTTGSTRTTRARYVDVTGTGNTLDPARSRRAAADHATRSATSPSNATSTASASTSPRRSRRDHGEFDRGAAFFDVIHQDPVLSQLKLIAEPWDIGPGGYQVGNFPDGWREWNGRYRDTMRDFWRGRAGRADFALRFTGSSDLFWRAHAHADGVGQLRHRPRRLHARRPRRLRAQAQRGQRGAQRRRE